MDFIIYYIRFKNVENQDIEIQLQDFDTYEDPPTGTIEVQLDGSHTPVILDTVEADDDVTKPIKGKRLSCGFNSGESSEDKDVENFSDGDDGRFLTRLGVGTGPLGVPFLGNLVLDDNQEAFQPQPNPVQLRAGEGLGSLKGIPLRESDGDVPVGHFRIIDYIYLSLLNLMPGQEIHVAMNLFELDTDPDTSHAFVDTYLDARTFETDVNERDDCYTVLTKIMDAFGCFLCYDHDGWYVIRWTEFDDITDGTTVLRFATFSDAGVFVGYSTRNVDKIIAHDGDPLYEGYRLSQDNALKRFQRRAGSVTHRYKLEQPLELPCNSSFLSGTKRVESPEDDTYDDFDFDCWTLHKGPPDVSNDGDAYIKVKYDLVGQESERYLLMAVQPTNLQYYVQSQRIDVDAGDKFSISVDIRHNGQVETAAGAGNYNVMQVRLYADDGTFYTLHPPEPTDTLSYWEASDITWATNNNYFKRFYDGLDDDTEWHNISADFEDLAAVPKNGYLTILLHQTKKSDQFETHFYNLSFEYVPLINGTYKRIGAQENKVEGDNDSRKNLKHEMFIGDSPKRLFKGALKKFDGTNFVLTETWNYYNDTGVLSDTPLGKHTVFAWWNQFRKTRTVIETDIQGLKTSDALGEGTPGLIHRWQIIHGNQEDKYFMLTSFRGMDFYLCAWNGVFVELSSGDGDRVYTDTHTFKFIQGE